MNVDDTGTIIDEADFIKDLVIFALYFDTTDFPMQYVLRKWLGTMPQDPPLYIGYDKKEAYKFIPPTCYNVGQDPEDPKIIETWL